MIPRLRSPIGLVVIGAFLVAVGAALWQTWADTPTSAAPGQEGYVSTQWGPLSPADRNALIQVRLAGLWEIPTGQQMQERGSQQSIRDVGALIERDHLDLDVKVRDVSKQLGVLLPNQATYEKQAWMEQITAATGANYDWMAVNLLRQAHGGVLPLIVSVRTGTRNALVRQFMDEGVIVVTRHIQHLEATGLVDFSRLDEAPQPPRAVVTRDGQYENIPVALLALGVLSVCTVLGVVLVRLVAERRRAGGGSRVGSHRRGSPP